MPLKSSKDWSERDAAAVRQAREQSGLNQTLWGRKLGLSQVMVSRLERAGQPLSAALVAGVRLYLRNRKAEDRDGETTKTD
jgi:transcriptional regulator with XRE-family HTH domain